MRCMRPMELSLDPDRPRVLLPLQNDCVAGPARPKATPVGSGSCELATRLRTLVRTLVTRTNPGGRAVRGHHPPSQLAPLPAR